MAAANITTKKDFLLQQLTLDIIMLTKATQADWLSYTGAPGVVVIGANNCTNVTNTETSTFDAPIYGTALVNGAHSGTTTTTIAYDGADATRITPYYALTTQGEILYVIADSGKTGTSGNLTVRRGALGTTAVALADNDVLFILNQINLSGAGVGYTFLTVLPLPADPGVPLFKAQNQA